MLQSPVKPKVSENTQLAMSLPAPKVLWVRGLTVKAVSRGWGALRNRAQDGRWACVSLRLLPTMLLCSHPYKRIALDALSDNSHPSRECICI